MSESATVVARYVGNPTAELDNPWPGGHPADGERVALLSVDVVREDGEAIDLRRYHVVPLAQATHGPIGPDRSDPQGITVRWSGWGTGTVLRCLWGEHDDLSCEVRPDEELET